jgi:hypothetical protein
VLAGWPQVGQSGASSGTELPYRGRRVVKPATDGRPRAGAAPGLAALGASVALVAWRADRLEALAAQLRDSGGTAVAVEADVTEAGGGFGRRRRRR